MPHSAGLDVSQKTTAICVVDAKGRRVWRGTCPTDPGQISQVISKHAGIDAKLGVETGAMTPWLVHGLRAAGVDVAVLDARRVKVALQMRLNKTDQMTPKGWRRWYGQAGTALSTSSRSMLIKLDLFSARGFSSSA